MIIYWELGFPFKPKDMNSTPYDSFFSPKNLWGDELSPGAT